MPSQQKNPDSDSKPVRDDQDGSKSDGHANGGLPAISLPKGGGAIRGMGEKFAANPVTGTGSMTVPIAVTPGRAGFSPQLTLSYDSGAGNGPFGLGWTLSMPAITRKTDKGLPKYQDAEESDVFILSGAEDLVPALFEKSGHWEADVFEHPENNPVWSVRRYRPRVEGLFARIERWTNVTTGETYWRSISKDNITTFYGRTQESRIADPDHAQRVFTWLICESRDDKGNAIIYEYEPENSANIDLVQAHERNRTDQSRSANRYLKRIKYGNRTSHLIQPDLSQTDWLFEVVFDYNEGHYEALPPDANSRRFVRANATGTSDWPVRRDPFSAFRAGFEVRTYRLCRRVLMFHHFPEELGTADYLVRATEFEYRETAIASFITSVTQSGYVRQNNGTYLKKSLPPLEFEYSEAVIQNEIHEVDTDSLENLPYGLDGAHYQWTDLDGEGVSGILTEQAQAWFYKPNIGQARFGPVQLVARMPSIADLNGGQQLMDLAGDGQLDLVQLAPPLSGFYERANERGWSDFTPFHSMPSLDWRNPNLKFVDLTGDGHADILISEDEDFTWYPSLAEEGFGRGERTRQSIDEEKGPRLVFADGTQSIFLADLSGDGLTDLVRIRNGEVCYWPNLGYGRFGARVTMDGAPWFDEPDQFDQRRIRLADIDGSGATDIVYLKSDGVRLYFNHSGNKWSEARRLDIFPSTDNLSSVTAVDLLGNGTACLVWSSPLPGYARQPMRYLELMHEKPHLMIGTKNNMGAETHVEYASSTKFYLADKAAGTPWVTRLPFPVHLVERVETLDRISRNRFVTRYAYHHGYFDGVEREFRGFGMVEQLDTEEFASLSASDGLSDATNIDAASHVPPVLTRTWFHTGAYIERGRVSKQFEHEYYREGDPSLGEGMLSDEPFESMLLPDTVLPDGLLAEEEREACRSLKGAILRNEIYALDQKEESDRPYSASERNYTIKLIQPRSDNRHAVFFTHARETIDFHYERKLFPVLNGRIVDEATARSNPNVTRLADPRVSHNAVLEVDDYDNVLTAVAIGYGRRFDDSDSILTAADRGKQKATLLTLIENRYTNAVLEIDVYRTPLLCESQTYELIKVAPTANRAGLTNLFHFQELADKVDAASDGQHDLAYEDINGTRATANHPYRRLVEHVRTLYRRDDLTAPLALGQLQSLSLPFESYKLAFTPSVLQQVYVDRVTETMMANEGRYVHSEGDNNWWIASGRIYFSLNATDTPSQELDAARHHFFLPRRFVDPFGSATTVSYDARDLLPIEARDALGNTVRSQIDYRVMQPRLVTDPNGNRAAAAFDALGMVVGTAVMGKESENLGDSLAGFEPDLDEPTSIAHLQNPFANPHDILNRAGTRLVYDLYQYQRTSTSDNPQPNVVCTLARETHDADLTQAQQTRIQHSFSYSDGFGREIQKKIQGEPGPLIDAGPAVNPRWVGSGWTIFNNKGKPVRQYEPFFSATHQFEFAKSVGVSPVLFYDPVERVVATLHPNHTYEKLVFDPWRQETWDVNDTVLEPDPRNDPDVGEFFQRLPQADYLPTWRDQRQSGAMGAEEQAAATKAAAHANTPGVAFFDTLSRPFLTVEHNKFQRNNAVVEERYTTRIELDIEGNQRSVTDALGRKVMTYDYDPLGTRIRQNSVDAGERWMLNDVMGKPMQAWDSRDHQIRHEYDALHRPTNLFVRTENGAEKLAERIVYGEGQLNDQRLNLRGRVFQQFDGAGVVTNNRFDFKGNLLSGTRQLLRDYKDEVDWGQSPVLENETFTSSTSYDALNRPVTLTAPDRSVIRPTYNDANLLERLTVNLRGAATATVFVTNIDYNAKGQRELIEYGNSARTEYEYDKETFRLTHLKTTRSGFPNDKRILQDLNYTYDPVGNITAIRDAAQQSIYFNNQVVSADSKYVYDALYRLISADGREHIGQVAQPPQTTWNDEFRVNLPHPNDGQAMRNYSESYQYDSVGNILSVIHNAANGNWTRAYAYDESNLNPTNNRLTGTEVGSVRDQYTYDAHGNMTRMPHLPLMEWDFKDQLHATQRQVVNNAPGEKTYYVYDAAGQRARKVTETANGTKTKERIYLGGFEVYRECNSGSVTLERETLHVMDDERRIALLETKTIDASAPLSMLPGSLTRYQFDNHLGSSCLEMDESAAVISYEEYYPYGTTSYQSGRNAAEVGFRRYRYTGKERDTETGFTYHGARYCAPWLGRWISTDPIESKPGSKSYHYSENSPTSCVDDGGMQPTSATKDFQPGVLRSAELDTTMASLNQVRQSSPDKFANWLMKPETEGLLNPILKRYTGGIYPSYGTPEGALQGFDQAFNRWKKEGQSLVENSAAGNYVPPAAADPWRKVWESASRDPIFALWVAGTLIFEYTTGRLLGISADPDRVGASAATASVAANAIPAGGRGRGRVAQPRGRVSGTAPTSGAAVGNVSGGGDGKLPGGAGKPHLHHIYPRDFAKRFEKVGIDWDRWRVKVPEGEHLDQLHGSGNPKIEGVGKGGLYNRAWKEFLEGKEMKELLSSSDPSKLAEAKNRIIRFKDWLMTERGFRLKDYELVDLKRRKF